MQGIEGLDEDGFAGYGVLRKLLEEVEVPATSPPLKGRPPLSRKGGAPHGKKAGRGEAGPGVAAPPTRAGLNSYESFEDLVMGTAGGMKRFESFEDLALRAGPMFGRVESFEELALRAGPVIRRFESFEDLAMRVPPVKEALTAEGPTAGVVAGDVGGGSSGEAGSEGDSGSREGAGRRSGREKKQKTWDWAVVDNPKRRRKQAGDETGKAREGASGQGPRTNGTAPEQASRGPLGQGLTAAGSRAGATSSAAGQSPKLTGQGELLTSKDESALLQPTGQDESAEGRLGTACGQRAGLPPACPPAGAPPRAVMPTDGLSQLAAGQSFPASSRGPGASLAGLGARGLSAMALHLLVDCAVDTERPANMATLMADLQTLALSTAGRLAGTCAQAEGPEGPGGAAEAAPAAIFTLPNGRAPKQGTLEPSARQRRAQEKLDGRNGEGAEGRGPPAAGAVKKGGKRGHKRLSRLMLAKALDLCHQSKYLLKHPAPALIP